MTPYSFLHPHETIEKANPGNIDLCKNKTSVNGIWQI
jgi:hypothetical protein